jgi:hypothetical protein
MPARPLLAPSRIALLLATFVPLALMSGCAMEEGGDGIKEDNLGEVEPNPDAPFDGFTYELNRAGPCQPTPAAPCTSRIDLDASGEVTQTQDGVVVASIQLDADQLDAAILVVTDTKLVQDLDDKSGGSCKPTSPVREFMTVRIDGRVSSRETTECSFAEFLAARRLALGLVAKGA